LAGSPKRPILNDWPNVILTDGQVREYFNCPKPYNIGIVKAPENNLNLGGGGAHITACSCGHA